MQTSGRVLIATGALVTAGALAAWGGTMLVRPQRYLLARFEADLASLPDQQALERLRQMASLGDDAVPTLVRALHSRRAEVADAARTVLAEELENWQQLPPADGARRIALLASELASSIEEAETVAQTASAELATRMLLSPTALQAGQQHQLLADCEHVLRSVGQPAQTARRSIPDIATRSLANSTEAEPITPLDHELHLPGGALPHGAQAPPAVPPSEQKQPQALPPDEEAELTPLPKPVEEPRQFIPRSAAHQEQKSVIEPVNAAGTLDVIQRLGSVEKQERETAEDELRERGFGEAQLAVVRKFADTRPQVRRELVEQLARQQVVDARPWLLKLVADSDRTVRLSAARVLLTTSDPQIVRALRERATVESDSEIRTILEGQAP